MMEALLLGTGGNETILTPGMRLVTLPKEKTFTFIRSYCKLKIIDSNGVEQVRDVGFPSNESSTFTFGADVEWIDIITEPQSPAVNAYLYINDTSAALTEISDWMTYNLKRIQIVSSALTKLPAELPPSINSLANLTNSPVFNSDITQWNTSNVTSMASAFTGCTNFNQPIGNWDVSNVKDMSLAFSGCANFNQPLNNWNVSNVTTFQSMFSNCAKFNQLLDNWVTSSCTNFTSIFNNCILFNSPLNTWDVSKAVFMGGMFFGCKNFNQPLNNWNTSTATNMVNTFNTCTKFNQDLSMWNVAKVTSRSNYDLGATAWITAYKPKFV